jgi:hypothetical protein
MQVERAREALREWRPEPLAARVLSHIAQVEVFVLSNSLSRAKAIPEILRLFRQSKEQAAKSHARTLLFI